MALVTLCHNSHKHSQSPLSKSGLTAYNCGLLALNSNESIENDNVTLTDSDCSLVLKYCVLGLSGILWFAIFSSLCFHS